LYDDNGDCNDDDDHGDGEEHGYSDDDMMLTSQ
jgi:hypothetical protein